MGKLAPFFFILKPLYFFLPSFIYTFMYNHTIMISMDITYILKYWLYLNEPWLQEKSIICIVPIHALYLYEFNTQINISLNKNTQLIFIILVSINFFFTSKWKRSDLIFLQLIWVQTLLQPIMAATDVYTSWSGYLE